MRHGPLGPKRPPWEPTDLSQVTQVAVVCFPSQQWSESVDTHEMMTLLLDATCLTRFHGLQQLRRSITDARPHGQQLQCSIIAGLTECSRHVQRRRVRRFTVTKQSLDTRLLWIALDHLTRRLSADPCGSAAAWEHSATILFVRLQAPQWQTLRECQHLNENNCPVEPLQTRP